MISFWLTITAPAIYVALTTYHQEMIPTALLMSILAAREGVPFPTIVETVGLLVIFEILREAGTRMPISLSNALSILGCACSGNRCGGSKNCKCDCNNCSGFDRPYRINDTENKGTNCRYSNCPHALGRVYGALRHSLRNYFCYPAHVQYTLLRSSLHDGIYIPESG